MKIVKYLSLILVVMLTVSCEKHTIQFDAESIGSKAEFQIAYYVPVTSASANNITKVEINGQMFANNKAPLNTYNAIPSGATGRFFVVDPGNINVKMYQGADMATLIYDRNVTVNTGKQNLVVHSFTEDPVVFDNGFPYTPVVTEQTDSTAWVKFYNFLYETAGVKTALRLQYQYLDSRTNAAVNIGAPVSFGETTGWIPVTVVKTDLVSAGSRTITFKIKTVDANGNIIADLQVIGTSGSYSAYTGTATLAIGRRYHQTMAGFRASSTATSSVRSFTAL
jgi:hypothetical protein